MLVYTSLSVHSTRRGLNSRRSRMIVFGFFFFQAEDGIRDLVRSRGLGDVYKRQRETLAA